MRQGDISETRIDESVLKILRMKASLGLHQNRLIDVEAVTREVARPENVAVAQRVADNAITLVRDNNQVLPLKANPPTLVQPQVSVLPQLALPEKRSETAIIVLTDDVRSTDAGRLFGSLISAPSRTRRPRR